jgi:hypothetical protein
LVGAGACLLIVIIAGGMLAACVYKKKRVAKTDIGKPCKEPQMV